MDGGGIKGVQLFFAISGFLITSRLIEEWNCFGQISLKRFYVRRVFRILPPAMTYLLVIALLGLLGLVPFHWREWLSAVCFFRNYMALGGAYFIESHYWSLSIEEQFYLIWPALLVLSGLYRARYTASILILVLWIWRWIAFHHVGGAAIGPEGWWHSEICFDSLLVGCLYALALESPALKKWFSKYLSVWVVAAILVFIFAMGGTWTPSGRTIQSTLMPLLIIATVLNPHTWLGRLLEIPVIRWVGRLSYSLYIWQELFTLQRMFPWYPLQFVALFGVAALSFYGLEKPFMKWGYRLAPPPSLGHNDLRAKHR
jgi:peptidoglycan/LPS O-acetylase OafA/YrhL